MTLTPAQQLDAVKHSHGIWFDGGRQKWMAQIFCGGKRRNLGRYDTHFEAAEAVDNARIFLREYFPDDLNHDKLNAEIGTFDLCPSGRTEALRAVLIAENAPVYAFPSFEAQEDSNMACDIMDRQRKRAWRKLKPLFDTCYRLSADPSQQLNKDNLILTFVKFEVAYKEVVELMSPLRWRLTAYQDSLKRPVNSGKLSNPQEAGGN
jgi:AP2 domain